MKLFKYIFILLMLFAQQAIAYTADCQSKLDRCKANLIKYANWGDGAYGSCAFSLSVQPNGEGGNVFVGTFEGGYIVGGVKQPSNTSCWFNCPSGQAVNDKGDCTTCPSGQVPAASGQGCTFPPNPSPIANPTPTPTCTAPKVFVPISGNCEVPVTCPTGQVLNTTANVCSTQNATSTNAANACNSQLDICNAAKSSAQGIGWAKDISCILSTSPTKGASVCFANPNYYYMKCTACSSGATYDAWAKDGSDMASSGGTGSGSTPSTSPSTSSDAPGLETRKTDCEGKGGKWDYVFDSTVSSSDTYREYWKCEIAGAVTSYGGNGAIIPNKGSTQSPTQDQNLNCGGTTGIACENTLQGVNKNTKGILDSIVKLEDTITKPFDVQDCSPGTQCYKDKEKSVLDDIGKYFNRIPTGVLDLQTIVKNTFLNPFAKSTAPTCSAYVLAPIKLEFYSIDGKKATYEQQLPGDLFCVLARIIRIFLISGAIISGIILISKAFVISS